MTERATGHGMEARHTSADRPRPPPSRRRDKPQLSCNLCRRRKLKCDRKHPCATCSKRGLAMQCAYADSLPASEGVQNGDTFTPSVSVQDRLRHLEDLVVAMMQQGASAETRQDLRPISNAALPSSMPVVMGSDSASDHEDGGSSNIADFVSLKLSESVTTYVEGSHWTAVLDGISELKEQLPVEEVAAPEIVATVLPSNEGAPGPLLLYGGVKHATRDDLLAAIPVRAISDRLISTYFNALDLASAVIHSGEFLNQYNRFWDDPSSASTIWISLLFGMFCLATQFQHASTEQEDLSSTKTAGTSEQEQKAMISIYQEKIVQSLVLGQYTRGGPFVVESLMHYTMVEHFLTKDADIGAWLMVGLLVNIAMRMGYHRDPRHLRNLTPFDAEMRRRVWATLYHIDLAISAQMGMPRLIKNGHTDTMEPRNLLDSDFDVNTVELPPSRPDTDATVTLYMLVKVRLVSVFALVSDLVTDTRPSSYSEVLRIDQSLNETHAKIPACFKWRPMSSSITDPPNSISQRMYLEMIYHKAQIVLHRRYLAPLKHKDQYAYSRKTAIDASMQMLRFHHIVDEEIQPTGRLYPIRWRYSSMVNHDFLLATFALCFFLRHNRSDIEQDQLEEIKTLFRKTQGIWIRASSSSAEAAKAAEALRIVLDSLRDPGEPPMAVDGTPILNQTDILPDALYQDYLSGFQMPFSFFNTMLDGPPMLPMTPADSAHMLGAHIAGQESWVSQLGLDDHQLWGI